jgi:hypothetical protein
MPKEKKARVAKRGPLKKLSLVQQLIVDDKTTPPSMKPFIAELRTQYSGLEEISTQFKLKEVDMIDKFLDDSYPNIEQDVVDMDRIVIKMQTFIKNIPACVRNILGEIKTNPILTKYYSTRIDNIQVQFDTFLK